MKAAISSVFAVAIAFVMLSGFSPVHEANYKIAPGFEIKVSGNDVEATFDSLSGNIRFASEHLDNVLFDVTVSALSINTGIEMKDNHAKSKGWLDAEHFPAIHYRSTKCKVSGDGFATMGDLEVHGIKQAVEIPFKFSGTAFTGEFDIKRSDFKVGKPKSKVAPDLHISLNVPVVPVH